MLSNTDAINPRVCLKQLVSSHACVKILAGGGLHAAVTAHGMYKECSVDHLVKLKLALWNRGPPAGQWQYHTQWKGLSGVSEGGFIFTQETCRSGMRESPLKTACLLSKDRYAVLVTIHRNCTSGLMRKGWSQTHNHLDTLCTDTAHHSFK